MILDALKMTLRQREPPADYIHHSDQGAQYTSSEYIDLLKEHKFQISIARKGNLYDNAMAESFIKTLKYEEVNL